MFFDNPKTLEEARKVKYGSWAGNPNGNKYQEGYCAYEVWGDFLIAHQCSNKAKAGPGNLYCGIHAKKVKG